MTRILRITVETQVPPTIVAVLLMMTVAAWPDVSLVALPHPLEAKEVYMRTLTVAGIRYRIL